jgi:hypothetical protein
MLVAISEIRNEQSFDESLQLEALPHIMGVGMQNAFGLNVAAGFA